MARGGRFAWIRRKETWTWVRRRRTWGVTLQVVTVGFAVLLAVLGGANKQPSKATNAVIVILVAGAQIGAGWAFSVEGKADPSLAQRSVGRLVRLAGKAQEAERRAQRNYESSSRSQALHAEMGIISTEFSWIGDGLVDAIEDWRTFAPQAVERAEGDGRT